MRYERGDAKMRVLIAEDEASLAKQLTSSISEAGYAVDCAGDGERAGIPEPNVKVERLPLVDILSSTALL